MADSIKNHKVEALEYLEDDHTDDKNEYPPLLRALGEEELRQLGRKTTMKLDLVIMPALTIMYILNYLDRNNIAASKLANITKDLHLSVTQFNTCVSILFVGYILLQIPSNLMISKIPYAGAYICLAMALWGVISACTAAANGFGGLLACRLCLGFIEAAFLPGALYYLSMFYTRKQLAFRTAILYSGSQLGNAFGTLLAIGILKLDGTAGLEGWRWLFLIEGCVTIGLAVLFACYLPGSPKKIIGFEEENYAYLQWSFREDAKQQDNQNEVSATKGFYLACLDPKTWLLMCTLYASYTAATVNNFFPIVVKGLGFSRNVTYALTAPPFCLCVICMIVNGIWSDRRGSRFPHIVYPLCITVVANVIAVSTLHVSARYVAMMLMPASFYSSIVVQLSWISNSISQPSVKRAASIAIIIACCNTPNIWTSYLYYSAPRYVAAFGVNLGAALVAITMATVTRQYLRNQNRLMDQGLRVGRSGPTDRQIAAGFRYIL